MKYNQKDSPLLVEFVIDTLWLQEIEITASFQKFTKEYILLLPKSPFNNQNIPWSLTLFFDTFGVLYISYLTKRTWEGFLLNDKSFIL